MAVKPMSDFDSKFSGIQYIVSPDGNEVRKTNGDPPVYLQFQAPFTTSWNPVTERVDVGFGGSGSAVPDTRTISTTAPIRIDGGASADLSADRTIALQIDNTSIVESGGNLMVGAIDATMHGAQTDPSLHADATAVSSGFMPPGMYTLLDTATNADSVGTIARRDGSGMIEFAKVTITGGVLEFGTTPAVLNVGGSEPITGTDTGEAILGFNVAIGAQSSGDPDQYQTGTGVMWFNPASSEPTAAPTTGVYLWYFGGNLKAWKAGAGAPVTVV